MSVFKCKMCGGTIEFEEGSSVGVCEYCGTKQTLPKLGDDEKTNLYDRANHFRRNNEYDKASGIYEKILEMDPSDSEAYWSLVLCRYGIEYVEDPQTHKRVPTINRAQFTSIFDDEDYKASIEHADSLQKTIYEDEAKTINEIQKGILAISQKEEPFDVFICYKETDDAGRRTQDSVLANDLYHQLTQEGFKVFFSRITLEDKLGTAYEPYIFAALNSAKVMVVIGTKPEYYNAVWVKNEWSRYLALVKQSAGKRVLIPAYRDMDPYDLPEEFSHLQAQDMSKLGFMQDLIRGIKKITGSDKTKQITNDSTTVNNSRPETSTLLRRVFMFLEDGDWKSADEYCEKVLDIDPECSDAYIGKLMAEKHVHKREQLNNLGVPFDDNNYFQKALRFGDEKIKDELTGYISQIEDRNENRRLMELYESALTQMLLSSTEDGFLQAAACFDKLKGFKDSDEKAVECRNSAKQAREDVMAAQYEYAVKRMEEAKTHGDYYAAEAMFDQLDDFEDAAEKAKQCREKADQIVNESNAAVYSSAIEKMETAKTEGDYYEVAKSFESVWGFKDAKAKATECRERAYQIRKDGIYNEAKNLQKIDTIQSLTEAKKKFQSIAEWKDSVYMVKACSERIAYFQEEERQRKTEAKEKAKRIVILVIITALIVFSIVMVFSKVIAPNNKYKTALSLYNSGEYEEAIELFTQLNDYKDSATLIERCETEIKEGNYVRAVASYNSGQYEQAIAIFTELDGYKDSRTQIGKCEIAINDEKLNEAKVLIDKGDYINAYNSLTELNGFKDSDEILENIKPQYNIMLLQQAKVGSFVYFGSYRQAASSQNVKSDIEWIVLAKEGNRILVTSKYAIGCEPYNLSEEDITWENCSLRKWLNDSFMNEAFNERELAMIPSVTVSADKNPNYSTNVGNSTTDQIFLLSIEEAKKYFSSDSSRICQGTEWCYVGAFKDSNNNCLWWLRTSGDRSSNAAYVESDGSVNCKGRFVSIDNYAVRPALWIDLEKLDVTD